MNYKLRMREGRKDSHRIGYRPTKQAEWAGELLRGDQGRYDQAVTPTDGMQYCFTVP